MNKKNLILMSTLLVCSLESFAQSDAEVTDSLWKDVDLDAVTVVASKAAGKDGDRQDDLQRAAGC